MEKVKGIGIYGRAFTRILIFRYVGGEDTRTVKIAAERFDIYAFRPNNRNAINTRHGETRRDGYKLQKVRGRAGFGAHLARETHCKTVRNREMIRPLPRSCSFYLFVCL